MLWANRSRRRAVLRCTSYSLSMRARALSASRRAMVGLPSISAMASASTLASLGGTHRPVSWSRISSGMPTTCVEMQGVPRAMPSTRMVGRPSRSPPSLMMEGATSTAAPFRKADTSVSGRTPASCTRSVSPRSSICFCSCGRSGPSPTSVQRQSMPRSRSRPMASMRNGKPFFSTRRPTATTCEGRLMGGWYGKADRSRPL